MNRLRPRPSLISGSLRASVSRISPQPLVMNRLTPLRYQLPVLVLVGPQPHRLQVAAGVRFGQHHGAGHLALGEPRQHLVLDLLAGKGVDRLGDALQAEHVHERGVRPADDLGGHRVDQVGAVQAAVTDAAG